MEVLESGRDHKAVWASRPWQKKGGERRGGSKRADADEPRVVSNNAGQKNQKRIRVRMTCVENNEEKKEKKT